MKGICPFLIASMLTVIAAIDCPCTLQVAAAALPQTWTRCLNNDVSGDEAVTACTAAIRKSPKDAKLFVQRGVAWSQTGDYDYAIGDFSQAIRLDPRNALAFYDRGIAREKKGELEQSLGDFQRYAELRPSDPDARIAIERVTVALAARMAPQMASSAIAEQFGNASHAQVEITSEPEATTPKALSSARDDFFPFIPALLTIAGIAAVALLMRKGGRRTADAHWVSDNPETEPVAIDANHAIEPDPPLAWYWSEYKGELDKSPR